MNLNSLGMLIASVALLIIGYSYFIRTQAYIHSKVEAHDYEMMQLGQMRRDQYLLDKKTGRVWTQICAFGGNGIDCEAEAWQEVPVVGLNYTEQELTNYINYLTKAQKDKAK